MSNLGALVVHGLFEHEGRHKDNVEWLKNLGIETYSLNLPGHGDIDEKGHIETWDENIEAIVNTYNKIANKDIKIIFAHSYGSLVSVSAILREKIDPDYLILSAPHLMIITQNLLRICLVLWQEFFQNCVHLHQ